MKKLAVVLVLAAAGLLAFNYSQTGELTLVPSFSKSEQEQAVLDLRDAFAATQKQLTQAHRTAGVSGIDTSADARAAIDEVRRIKRELDKLRTTLSEEKAKSTAAELATAIREFEETL